MKTFPPSGPPAFASPPRWAVAAVSLPLLVALAGLTFAAGQNDKKATSEPKTPAAAPPDPAIVAAAGIVGVGQSASVVGLLAVGRRMALWDAWSQRAETLDPELLQGVGDLTVSANPKKAAREHRARDETIVVASQNTGTAFANSAVETRGKTFGEILASPSTYRGKVIHVEGRLKTLHKLKPSDWAARQGVKDVYEATIFAGPSERIGVLALVTELPAGMKTGSDLQQHVALDAYFFKKHLRQSSEEFLVMPLVIGRTLVLTTGRKKAADQTGAPAFGDFLYGVKDQKPLATPVRNVEEHWGYLETIALAARTSPEALAAAAAENPGVGFPQLHDDPAGYRGKVIHVEGVLQRLDQIEVPSSLRKRGVKHLYEGWIFGKTLGSNPFFVTFTELPKKIRPGDDLKAKVACDGYFFKKYLYQATKDPPKGGRYTSMLIGRSIAIQDRASARKNALPVKAEAKSRYTRAAPRLRDHVDPRSLDEVEDEKPIAKDAASNPGEFTAWCETVHLASQTSAAAFAASAEKNAGLTYNKIMKDRAGARGEVVHISGRLKRLRVAESPAYLKVKGIKTLYEGWILGKGWGSRPSCVILTDLPEGIIVAEEISYPVSFDGYFFKVYRYSAAKDRYDAPYLVGRTLAVKKSAAESWASNFSSYFIVGLFAVLGGTLVLVLGLAWSFRRSDRATRLRLKAARELSMPELEGADMPPTFTDDPGALADRAPDADLQPRAGAGNEGIDALRNGH